MRDAIKTHIQTLETMLANRLRCDFEFVNITDNIIFIRDKNLGRMSVTNDADEVFHWICQIVYPGRRLVYQDSEGNWAEMVKVENWLGTIVAFKEWHGEVWDILTRTE